MSEDSEDLFVPFVDEDGRVTGVMDEMTAGYLASTEPDPTQASLDAAFAGVTRIRLVGYRHEPCVVEYDGQEFESYERVFDVVRVDVSDPASLAELAAAMKIAEADEFGHVLTVGDHHLELWAGDHLVHTLELLDWNMIRRPSVWAGDADLAEPRRFEDWLLRHGIEDARDSRAESERRDAEWLASTEDWERAMPPGLRPMWPHRLGYGPDDMSPADLEAAQALLRAAIPDPVARVRALYTWFGAGKGPWSGYPFYENVAERLLLAYPVEVLLAALDTEAGDVAAAYGAARLFSGCDFGQSRREDRKRCPEALRRHMLDAVMLLGNTDNCRAVPVRVRHARRLIDVFSSAA